MSCNEWESGTILLPSAAVKPLRDQLNKTLNESRDALWAAAKLVSAQLRKVRIMKGQEPYFFIGNAVTDSGVKLNDARLGDLHEVLAHTWDHTHRRFRAVVAADLDHAVGPKGTSRTTTWMVGCEASIALDGRTLHWNVQENNRSVDAAHRHPMGVALFDHLDAITWTRGTGGELVGNDEYNQDSRDSGGGSNYVTRRWAFVTKAEREALALAARNSRRYRW